MPATIFFHKPDLVTLVQMHLSPRHLYKLMQTSSGVKQVLLDNEEYWSRVAAHLIWREHVIHCPFFNDEDTTKHPQAYLYKMQNLRTGYKSSMDEFFELIKAKMQEAHPAYEDPDFPLDEDEVLPDEYSRGEDSEGMYLRDVFHWSHLVDLSLKDKVYLYLDTWKKNACLESPLAHDFFEDCVRPSMLEVCKQETLALLPLRKCGRFRRIAWHLDDDTKIPLDAKKDLAQQITNILKFPYDHVSVICLTGGDWPGDDLFSRCVNESNRIVKLELGKYFNETAKVQEEFGVILGFPAGISANKYKRLAHYILDDVRIPWESKQALALVLMTQLTFTDDMDNVDYLDDCQVVHLEMAALML